jgi:hypothetical protein
MDSAIAELIKQREVAFCPLHANSNQAETAGYLLTNVNGIYTVETVNQQLLHITYNIQYITLQTIEDALTELGFHLDNSLFAKLKRALLYYSEETQLANLGYEHPDSKSTREIFINRYDHLLHGCRDKRPPHYRHYN